MNLSPFTKGSRVLRAFNVILPIFVRSSPLTNKTEPSSGRAQSTRELIENATRPLKKYTYLGEQH